MYCGKVEVTAVRTGGNVVWDYGIGQPKSLKTEELFYSYPCNKNQKDKYFI